MSTEVLAPAEIAQTKDWTDYSTGIAWGTITLFILVLASYATLITAIATGALGLVAGMFISTLLIYMGFTVAHEAGHGSIAHEVSWMKPVERLMGWSMTLPFMILPFGLFAKIHDYHHAFTNDPDRDPDHWVSGDTWLEASLRAPTLALNYLYLTATRFKNDPVITKTHKSSIVYYITTLSMVTSLVLSGYALELLMIGIIPVFLGSYVLGMLFDWIPHMPTRQQGRYQNTRSYLFPGLQFLTMYQNYHHIHHLYPRVSWYNYARVFNIIRNDLEAKNAPIEELFSTTQPGFGKSINALEPRSLEGIHKLTLQVEKVHQETVDSVVISFKNLNGKTLPFKSGQYVTVSKLLQGEIVTRCYSICESIGSNKLSIGVKRVENGKLSTYLNDELQDGDELTVAGPFGDFFYDPDTSKDSGLLTLIAGGSGITPTLSIAKTALEQQLQTKIHLIYANRSIYDVMFLRQLNKLLLDYPERFSVSNIFSTPHGTWTGETGHLNQEKLLRILSSHSASDAERKKGQYFICGPAPMKNMVMETLQTSGINDKNIFIEEFVQTAPKPEGPVHQVNIVMANGINHQLKVAENQTVLQAATQEGVKIPHACGVGQCGCCMMQVTRGDSELIQDETPGLLPGEQERGLTLALSLIHI